MSLLVPKNRKPKFRVQLAIQDLTNVPLVSGLVHVRWHLQDSLRSEARGKTERSPILDHKVDWRYETGWTAKLVIDRSNRLQDAHLLFEVYQEMYGGKERHALGKLEINLAEYAHSEEQVSRRYLLQNSKVNSTLKLGISMDQVSGDRDYSIPELKKAQVFGGLAGLLSEGKEMKKRGEDVDGGAGVVGGAGGGGGAGGSGVSGGNGYAQEQGTAADRVAMQLEQDVYRNSIVRRWQAQAGELDPASVVDDIFAGSDGWVRPYGEQDHRAGERTVQRRRRESEDQSIEEDGSYREDSRRWKRDSGAPDHHHHQQQQSHNQGAGQDQHGGEFAWTPQRQAFEADEMLRSLTWTIDPVQVEKHVGKSLEQRQRELMA